MGDVFRFLYAPFFQKIPEKKCHHPGRKPSSMFSPGKVVYPNSDTMQMILSPKDIKLC
jgi:hypothetical protein